MAREWDREVTRPRVCIIGAGPSGMSALYQIKLNVPNEIDVECYEKQATWGGLWNYSWRTDWCNEKDVKIDLQTVDEEELATHLTRFYGEIVPKQSQRRPIQEYHKNSLKNIRSALNRYIQMECGRPINIVSGPRFKRCNDMLNGKLKYNARHGLSAPTAHKAVINQNDMMKINEYLKILNPITLRYRVWVQLGIHFCSRGLEFHCQLSRNSFCFQTDEMGKEYVTLSHNTQQKNHQGDLTSTDENPDKRMYSTNDDLCPVQSLRMLISKTVPDATSLFNHLEKTLPDDPSGILYWYSTKPVGKRQFSNFMPDICRNAGLSARYTAHCLRATALNAMTDNNVPGRHIMSLSDHKNEVSLMPYTRPSSCHKQNMSKILAGLFSSSENKENETVREGGNSQVQSGLGQSEVSIKKQSPSKQAVEAGTDEFGEQVHSTMYKHLWTIGPKEAAEFSDYSYKDHFGKLMPSYVPREITRQYLHGRFTRGQCGDMKPFVKFRHVVTSVEYDDCSDRFIVWIRDLLGNQDSKQVFTHVVVASGVFSVPNYPSFPGMQTFPGRILHSRDFRDAREFVNQTVLIIGSRFSASDIAVQLVKYGAKHVICTYRDRPMNLKGAKSIEERPLLQEVKNKTVYFKDSTCSEVDSIIICTGYIYHFPYLQGCLKFDHGVQTCLMPDHMYKGTVWTRGGNNKLLFIGPFEVYYNFALYDIQGQWIYKYILNIVPNEPNSPIHMLESVKIWQKKHAAIDSPESMLKFQRDFAMLLAKDVGYPLEYLDRANKLLLQVMSSRMENIWTYRNRSFPTLYTRELPLEPTVKWDECMDEEEIVKLYTESSVQ